MSGESAVRPGASFVQGRLSSFEHREPFANTEENVHEQ